MKGWPGKQDRTRSGKSKKKIKIENLPVPEWNSNIFYPLPYWYRSAVMTANSSPHQYCYYYCCYYSPHSRWSAYYRRHKISNCHSPRPRCFCLAEFLVDCWISSSCCCCLFGALEGNCHPSSTFSRRDFGVVSCRFLEGREQVSLYTKIDQSLIFGITIFFLIRLTWTLLKIIAWNSWRPK